MKIRLLTPLFLLFTVLGFAQVAPQIPGLQECDSNDGTINGHAIFNMYMDAQLQILAAQPLPAENYEVTFYHSAVDAASGNNLINSFDYYSGTSWENIYYRVKRLSNNSWVIGNFNLYVIENLDTPDVTACTSYTLPPPTWPIANYYSGPGGTGTIIPPGTVITATQTIYIYSDGCNINESFTVTIDQVDLPGDMVQSVVACGSYTIPPTTLGQYYTGDGGTGTQIAAGTVLTQETTYYLNFGGACNSSIPQNIYFGTEGYIHPMATLYQVCDTDSDGFAQADLTTPLQFAALAPNTVVTYHLTQSDAQAGINAIANPQAFTNTIPFSQTIYTRVASANGDCHYVKESPLLVQYPDLEASYTITACDPNEDGIYTLSLQDFLSLQNTIAAGDDMLIISFYETMADAQNATNMILVTENGYVGLTTTLYARGEYGFGCFDTAAINITLNPSCSDNRVLGVLTYDSNNNGCTSGDFTVTGAQAVYTGNGQTRYSEIINGSFLFTELPNGPGTITIQNNIPGVATVSPASVAVDFPAGGMEQQADFCATPTAQAMDVTATLVPVDLARPGFVASYIMVVTNNATPANNVTVSLQFDSSKLAFYPASTPWVLSGNTLTYTYNAMQPFATHALPVYFLVAQPPTVQGGMVLSYTATVSATGSDTNPANNTFVLNQTVVNSYDPNDINVAQGASITPAQTADDLNYTIRFQNTGTASAIRVRVETTLDANLDWNSFRFLASDHEPVVQRNGNKVTFLFENIYLPAEQDDEPASHGYITYRIKPVSGIQLGESMQATANIYFDYNPAVVTNTVTTTVMQPMGIDNNTASLFSLYPNPANGTVNLNLNGETGTATITDILGKTVAIATLHQQTALDISALKSGMYFVKVACGGREAVQKLVVK